MRWGYLVPRVVIVLGAWLFFTFAFDPLLRWGTVESGQQFTGAKVDVEGLDTDFFPPTVSIARVQLADQSEPMTNLVEFDSFRFRIDGDALSHRKLVIDEGMLTGLKWGTPRTESGQLPAQLDPDFDLEEETGPGMFDGWKDQAKALGEDWLDELLKRAESQADPNQFESVRLADAMYKDWKTRFDSYEDRIKDFEKRIKEIEQTVKNAKGTAIERLQEYDRVRREVNDLLAEADAMRKELPDLGNRANSDYLDLDAARRKDLEDLKNKLKLFQLDAESVSDALIGPEMRERLATTIEWVQWTQKKLDAVKQQPEPERLRGIDVDFSRPNEMPNLLVRKLKLTGEANIGGEIVPFKGLVTDITSDPRRHGKPVVIQLYGKKSAIIQVKAVIDHTVDKPVYDVAVAYSLPEQTEMKLGRESKLMLNLAARQTDWLANFRLQGEEIAGNIHLKQSPVTITLTTEKKVRPEIKRMLEHSLTKVRDVEATIALSGPYRKPKWKVESTLGRQISDGVNDVLSSELEAKRLELTAKVDTLTREKMDKLSVMVNEHYKELIADLNLNEQHAQTLIQRFADSSGINVDKLGDKLGLDGKTGEMIRKAGLDQPIDLEKLDPKKLDLKKLNPKSIDLEKLNPKNLDLEKLNPKNIDLNKIDLNKIDPAKLDPKKLDVGRMRCFLRVSAVVCLWNHARDLRNQRFGSCSRSVQPLLHAGGCAEDRRVPRGCRDAGAVG